MNFIFNLICRCSGFVLIVFLFSNTSVFSAEKPRLDDPATWANPSFWKSLKPSGQITGWEFRDGEISLVRPGKKGGNGSILSEPVASNFELSFEWKIAANVNSGVKYRVRKHGAPFWTTAYKGSGYWGIEYQIYDGKPGTDALHTTGAIYDLASAAAEKKVHPPGEWNSAKMYEMEHSSRVSATSFSSSHHSLPSTSSLRAITAEEFNRTAVESSACRS